MVHKRKKGFRPHLFLKLIMSSLMDSVSIKSVPLPDKTELTTQNALSKAAFYRTTFLLRSLNKLPSENGLHQAAKKCERRDGK